MHVRMFRMLGFFSTCTSQGSSGPNICGWSCDLEVLLYLDAV